MMYVFPESFFIWPIFCAIIFANNLIFWSVFHGIYIYISNSKCSGSDIDISPDLDIKDTIKYLRPQFGKMAETLVNCKQYQTKELTLLILGNIVRQNIGFYLHSPYSSLRGWSEFWHINWPKGILIMRSNWILNYREDLTITEGYMRDS